VDREPLGRFATSGIIAPGGVAAAGDGTPVRRTTRDVLPRVPIRPCPVLIRRSGIALRFEVDQVRTECEDFPEPAQLRHLRHPPSTLPEVDRLGLDTDLKSQFVLRPSPFLSQLSNGLHEASFPLALHYNIQTRTKSLVMEN
jgi:hypothetical protein